MRAEQAPTVAVAEPAPSAWVRALTAWRRLRSWWGLALLLFAASVTMAGIGTRVNNPPWSTEDVHWGLDVFLFWIMLWWIAMLEGCQISIVGLQRHDPEIFKETHPRAYKSCKLVLAGANVERFLVGRQFLLIFNGFLASRVGGSKTIDIPAGEPFSIGREHLPEYYEPHASCDNGSCHVSREQLRILASTSSAKITAVGLNKIGHRSAARYAPLEWQYLSRGESFEVFCGCRILLDSRQEATSQIELVSVEDQEKSGASGEIRRTTSNKRPREAENTAPTLPFRRGNIYLNLLPGEVRTPRHVNWLDLLPMDCTCALFTSLFPKESYDWLRQVCPDLKRALVVADRCIKPKPNPPPTLTAPRNDDWLLLEGARTAGNFHCSLILFRTPNYLRVALGGTNLEGQMEKDRDSLFVQDFPLKSDYEGDSRRRDYNDDDDVFRTYLGRIWDVFRSYLGCL